MVPKHKTDLCFGTIFVVSQATYYFGAFVNSQVAVA